MAKKEWRSSSSFSTASAFYQNNQVIGESRVVIIFGHKVPNLRRVGFNQPHHALLVDSVVGFIEFSAMKERTIFQMWSAKPYERCLGRE